MSKETILDEVRDERQRQDEQWGGAEHDDLHQPGTWVRFIVKQITRASVAINSSAPGNYRGRLVKVAALAVAAIESYDRRRIGR